MFLAATRGDNTNLVIAQIAQRRFKVPRVVVRVADPGRPPWYGEQGLFTVSPTQVAIDQASELVLSTTASSAAIPTDRRGRATSCT